MSFLQRYFQYLKYMNPLNNVLGSSGLTSSLCSFISFPSENSLRINTPTDEPCRDQHLGGKQSLERETYLNTQGAPNISRLSQKSVDYFVGWMLCHPFFRVFSFLFFIAWPSLQEMFVTVLNASYWKSTSHVAILTNVQSPNVYMYQNYVRSKSLIMETPLRPVIITMNSTLDCSNECVYLHC